MIFLTLILFYMQFSGNAGIVDDLLIGYNKDLSPGVLVTDA
jgi:hypothetical protein